jgi:hypothetical protein
MIFTCVALLKGMRPQALELSAGILVAESDSQTVTPATYVFSNGAESSASSTISPPSVLNSPDIPQIVSDPLSSNAQGKTRMEWTGVVLSLVWDGVGAYVDSLKAENDNIRIVKDKLNRTNKLSSEICSTYKCGGFRRYGCTYAMKFVHKPNREFCLVFERGEHFHSTPNLDRAGIPQHLKPILETGFQMCSKPAKIYRELKKRVPCDIYNNITPKQVAQAVVYMRKKNGSALKQNTVGYLYEWLEKNQLGISSEMHTVGVLPGWVARGPVNIEDSSVNIHFVLTTKRLLYNLVQQANCSFGQLVALDGTYSLLDLGYPVLKCGTIDAAHRYHDVCVCVSRHENQEAFKLMLQSIKDSLFLFYQFVMQPRTSIPDKARAIYNALSTIFPADDEYAGVSIAICYFHNKQAIEFNKARFTSEERRQAFQGDVEKAHAITSTIVFKNAMQLFQSKWSRKEKTATEWYMSEWGQTLFHAGATPVGAPVANSTTERSNRSLKDNVTNHERLAMGNFIDKLSEELEFQSGEADKFPLSVILKNTREQWCKAQLWLKVVKKFIRERTGAASKVLYVPSSSFIATNSAPSLQDLRNAIYQFNNKQVYKYCICPVKKNTHSVSKPGKNVICAGAPN